eukprot:scaffold9766_cov51-Phaeocystis_antarctica.AAC.2
MSRSPSPSRSTTCTDCVGVLSAPGVSVPEVYVSATGSYTRSVPRIVPGFVASLVVGLNVSGPRYSTFSPPSLTVTMSGKLSPLTSATTTSVVFGVVEPGTGALISMGMTAEKSLLPGLR